MKIDEDTHKLTLHRKILRNCILILLSPAVIVFLLGVADVSAKLKKNSSY